MPFDAEAFARAQYRPRTARVPVPSLADFFAPGEEPAWEVRGLTAAELYRANDAKQRQAAVGHVVDALAAQADKASELRRVLGLAPQSTPGEVAKRLEMLVDGSVAPKIELGTAVLLAERFPIEFLAITNVITDLTGQGSELVKPAAASQLTPASTTE